jgi:dephospho-CoA kinase
MIIGLTGGIASGKSTVSAMLKELGAEIIDADQISREIVEPGQLTLQKLINYFGDEVLSSDGTLNRKMLGKIVFSDPEKLMALNQITHPAIDEVISKRIQQANSKIIIVDSPLLLECGQQNMVDEVWLVIVDYDTQVKRLMNRNNLSIEDANKRVKAQMPLEEKVKLSNKVIDNNEDLQHTREQVLTLWNYINK